MIFTELRFLAFLAVVLAVHWALRNAWTRKLWLLAASYLFYGLWDWRFLSLIVGSTALDYFVGLKLEGNDDERSRKRWITLSVAANLGLLGVFKYTNFFLDSAIRLANALGFEASPHVLGIVLPVGISFYTFQTMSYSLDVYRRNLRAVRDPLDFALFVAFFPQLVAGPIVRAVDFLPQLDVRKLWRDVRVRACLTLFLVGYVKKACIGDNVATLVDPYFDKPGTFDALGAWTAVLHYAVQIYCDFSGYSDMAIATAGLFGYELRLNFDFPYLASSIRDFWRRWHMSLSSWLRDYLYIPLGGNRGSRLFQHRNLMLTMLLGGLWHGAGWNFVIWGALHGGALVVHREWERAGLRMPRFLGYFGTFLWVCIAWIFFRAKSLDGALVTLRSFALFASPGAKDFGWVPLATFATLAGAHMLGATHAVGRALDKLPDWAYALFLGLAVPLALAFTNSAVKPFIYLQF